MSRVARYEIVHTAAGWHARFRADNGAIVWTTETYTRRRAALRAIEANVDPFTGSWVDRWYDLKRGYVDAVLYRSNAWEKTDAVRLEIRDVDERDEVDE